MHVTARYFMALDLNDWTGPYPALEVTAPLPARAQLVEFESPGLCSDTVKPGPPRFSYSEPKSRQDGVSGRVPRGNSLRRQTCQTRLSYRLLRPSGASPPRRARLYLETPGSYRTRRRGCRPRPAETAPDHRRH